MYVFYMSLEKPVGSRTENTFSIWKSHNNNVRMKLNGNKLVNVRRDITNKKRLTDIELREIKEKFISDEKDIDSGNVGIRDGDVDDRDEGTGGTNCPDADTRVVRRKYVDQRENVNHNKTLDDIPTDEELDEGNHNESYDIIMISLCLIPV